MHDRNKTSADLTYGVLRESVEWNDIDAGPDHNTTGDFLQCHSHYPYLRGYVYESK